MGTRCNVKTYARQIILTPVLYDLRPYNPRPEHHHTSSLQDIVTDPPQRDLVPLLRLCTRVINGTWLHIFPHLLAHLFGIMQKNESASFIGNDDVH